MKLREYRLKHNLTQNDVGKLINKTGTGYGHYESGKNEPDIKTLITLAKYYHTTIDDLVDLQPENILNVALLSDEEQSIINIVQKLNKDFLLKVEAYAYACYERQNEEDEIIKKIKG